MKWAKCAALKKNFPTGTIKVMVWYVMVDDDKDLVPSDASARLSISARGDICTSHQPVTGHDAPQFN